MLEEVIQKISGAFRDTLPNHKAGLTIEHNPHKTVYESVKSFTKDEDASWVSDLEKQSAIDNDELWALTWYPDTPIGMCKILGASLQSVMVAMYVSEVMALLEEEEAKKAVAQTLVTPNKPELITEQPKPKLITSTSELVTETPKAKLIV